MLLVRARRGGSVIHGFGLIAEEYIPAGTRIWELRPEFDVLLTEEQLEALSPIAREQVLHYCYFDSRHRTYVLSSDDDRFTNHSDDPNTIEHADGISSVAVRDIHPGEEITWNYRGWVAFGESEWLERMTALHGASREIDLSARSATPRVTHRRKSDCIDP